MRRAHGSSWASGCARWSRQKIEDLEDPYPLMVLRAGIEFNEWFAEWCERMEAQLLEPAREKGSS